MVPGWQSGISKPEAMNGNLEVIIDLIASWPEIPVTLELVLIWMVLSEKNNVLRTWRRLQIYKKYRLYLGREVTPIPMLKT